ncbi:MAG: glycosyl transferase family 1 [Ignavibacteria bacterium RIFOXYC2_FULL_35_21]|nr:MAG: glycosyl transferase family 1 [Ignavibacteria bacterium RIFOXYA2_FULL_35_10]OGV23640.1 MAG: glycosyl transferase family 1 [Ignavibacteria bacterium RIFOXYC2_FULL_35_21]
MISIQNYYGIVDDEVIHKLYNVSKKLFNKRMVHINSTFVGGGVAEMLSTFIPLMNDIGVEAEWRIQYGVPDFFAITKEFHNALQGDNITLSEHKRRAYLLANERFSTFTRLHHDLIIIHDPQPLPLINYYIKKQPWIWRCHIDLSHPNKELWAYLKKFIIKYDMVIVSNEKYIQDDLPIQFKIINPAISPLSTKNMELSDKEIEGVLQKYKIPTDKKIITQISRFDKWKDPEGVIELFKIVKQKCKDCRLVLCGSMATDDPEGIEIYKRVQKKASSLIESGDIILITVENNFLVNALQRASAVIIQKSIKEGFGLTVTEALWKGAAVVASRVGGIPLQITDGVSGYLLDPQDVDGFAERIIYLLQNESKAKEFGIAGKEHVRKNFLMTRLLLDYMNLMNDIF